MNLYKHFQKNCKSCIFNHQITFKVYSVHCKCGYFYSGDYYIYINVWKSNIKIEFFKSKNSEYFISLKDKYIKEIFNHFMVANLL